MHPPWLAETAPAEETAVPAASGHGRDAMPQRIAAAVVTAAVLGGSAAAAQQGLALE